MNEFAFHHEARTFRPKGVMEFGKEREGALRRVVKHGENAVQNSRSPHSR